MTSAADRPLVLFGCGALAVETLENIQDLPSPPSIHGVIDEGVNPRLQDAQAMVGHSLALYPSLAAVSAPEQYRYLVTLSFDAKIRAAKFLALQARGLTFFTLLHPLAKISKTAVIGPGCIVNPFALIGQSCSVAENVLVNNYVAVGHYASIGASSVLCPYAAVSGYARCGERSLLGTGAILLPNAALGDDSKLSAGSVLKSQTGPGVLAHGNPAKARVLRVPVLT